MYISVFELLTSQAFEKHDYLKIDTNCSCRKGKHYSLYRPAYMWILSRAFCHRPAQSVSLPGPSGPSSPSLGITRTLPAHEHWELLSLTSPKLSKFATSLTALPRPRCKHDSHSHPSASWWSPSAPTLTCDCRVSFPKQKVSQGPPHPPRPLSSHFKHPQRPHGPP